MIKKKKKGQMFKIASSLEKTNKNPQIWAAGSSSRAPA
jgi:hypothetical protein